MKEVTSLFFRSCASFFQRRPLFQSTGVSCENVHKFMEIVGEIMHDACYIHICSILDGYRMTKLWGLELQEGKVSCFVTVTGVCVAVS